jgi:hypothetical protein
MDSVITWGMFVLCNVSETVSVSIIRCKGAKYHTHLGLLERIIIFETISLAMRFIYKFRYFPMISCCRSLQRKVTWLRCFLSLIKDFSCVLEAPFSLDPYCMSNDSGKLCDRFIIRILCWILFFVWAIFNIHKISENYSISVFRPTGQEDSSHLGPSSVRD